MIDGLECIATLNICHTMYLMDIHYRKPTPKDGSSVHLLINRCPPLDKNSLYCNLLQCQDFAETSILAETDEGEVIGFISGYLPPQREHTLFIWQVALDAPYRGHGIASEMLSQLFDRNPDIHFMETTISPSNKASEMLFTRFFSKHHMDYETHVLFDSHEHFQGEHEDEVLYRAGPAKKFAPVFAG